MNFFSVDRLEHLSQFWLLALWPKVNVFRMKIGNQFCTLKWMKLDWTLWNLIQTLDSIHDQRAITSVLNVGCYSCRSDGPTISKNLETCMIHAHTSIFASRICLVRSVCLKPSHDSIYKYSTNNSRIPRCHLSKIPAYFRDSHQCHADVLISTGGLIHTIWAVWPVLSWADGRSSPSPISCVWSRVDVQVAAYTCVLAECLIATSAVRAVLWLRDVCIAWAAWGHESLVCDSGEWSTPIIYTSCTVIYVRLSVRRYRGQKGTLNKLYLYFIHYVYFIYI
jgi:hypothetical protein